MLYRMLWVPLVLLVAGLALATCGGEREEPTVPEISVSDSGEDRLSPTTDPDATADVPADSEPESEAAPDAASPTGEPEEEAVVTDQPTTADYTVQVGDTLFEIADRFGVSVDDLIILNQLPDPDTLDVGQVLLIPVAPTSEDEEPVAEPDEPDGEADEGTPAEEPEADSPAENDSDGAVLTEIPNQPANFDDYAVTALAWLHSRDTVDSIVPLFEAWGMPPVAGGARLNLIDTDRDGLFSIVIVYTDPRFFGAPQAASTLVIYDPIPDRLDRYRIAYEYGVQPDAEIVEIAVLNVTTIEDVTGDGRPNVAFKTEQCDVNTCMTSIHVLVSAGSGYRDAVAEPINIPTARTITFNDRTGDGLPDIAVQGGTIASVSAGPPRESLFVYSGAGGVVRLISQERLPTQFLVWVVSDGNEAFAAGHYDTAVTHYNAAITDNTLTEWGATPNERAQLVALARLRRALAFAQLGDPTSAAADAQAAAADADLMGQLANAFLSGFAGGSDLTAGCASLNNLLALHVGEFDSFWASFGSEVPEFRAEDLCPF